MTSSNNKWNVFFGSLKGPEPPSELSISLKSLWLAGNGKWEEAHTLVNDLETPDAMHVHAYLHRVEGDSGNAAYWYRRAGQPVFRGSTDEEWEMLVRQLLGEKQ